MVTKANQKRQPDSIHTDTDRTFSHLAKANQSKMHVENKTGMLVLPPQYSNRLFRSSWLTVTSVYAAAFHDHWICFNLTLLVLLTSLNYWRHPVHGWRRNMDMLAVFLGFAYHIYCSLACESPLHQYLYYGFVVKTAYCYSKARSAHNKDVSSKWHMTMHLVGNIGNCILYAGGLRM